MKRLFSACALLALAGATAFPATAADPAPRVFALTAQNGSGENGTVVLAPQGNKTEVSVALVSAPAGVAQPAHVHVGPCDKLDPKPKYPLKPVTDGVSETVLDVPMETLLSGGFAVNVHKSATEIATYVACGNLSAPSKM